MTTKKVFTEKIWVPSESKFNFREQIDPKTGERKYVLKGLMLPFGKISRNGVMYNKESITQKHQSLIGKPMMYNHKVDGAELPIGHFVNSYVDEKADIPGWYYEADIDPEEKNFIRKLERGDLRHVSIQLIGDSVEEAFDSSGKAYTEAWVGDIIEGSIVPAPGFLDTTAKFAEAFGREGLIRPADGLTQKDLEEDINTSTADGSMATKMPKEEACQEGEERFKEDEQGNAENDFGGFPMDEFYKGLKEEMEHAKTVDNNIFTMALIAIDHLKEDPQYYTKLEQIMQQPEQISEVIVNELGEEIVKEAVK